MLNTIVTAAKIHHYFELSKLAEVFLQRCPVHPHAYDVTRAV